MALARTKTKAHVRTMTRTALLRRTTHDFLEVISEYDPTGVSWLQTHLDLVIEHELFQEISLVVYDAWTPVSEVTLEFDWHEHSVLKTVSNQVDVSGFDEGANFHSTYEVIQVMQDYLAKLALQCGNLRCQTWYQENPTAKLALGEDAYYDLIQISRHHIEEDKKAYSRISAALIARRVRRAIFPDAQELSVKVR